MPSFGKIVRAVSENEPKRTDGSDSIGPFGFQPGTNLINILDEFHGIFDNVDDLL